MFLFFSLYAIREQHFRKNYINTNNCNKEHTNKEKWIEKWARYYSQHVIANTWNVFMYDLYGINDIVIHEVTQRPYLPPSHTLSETMNSMSCECAIKPHRLTTRLHTMLNVGWNKAIWEFIIWVHQGVHKSRRVITKSIDSKTIS